MSVVSSKAKTLVVVHRYLEWIPSLAEPSEGTLGTCPITPIQLELFAKCYVVELNSQEIEKKKHLRRPICIARYNESHRNRFITLRTVLLI